MRLSKIATLIVLAGLVTGCMSANKAPSENVTAASAKSALNGTAMASNASIIDHKKFDGHLTFVAANVPNPRDPATFHVTFPPAYHAAVLEMMWTPSFSTNQKLSLMLHTKGGADASAMVLEKDGESPLRAVVAMDKIPAGEYDVIGYVPLDGSTPLVLNQDFTIHVTLFDGSAPEDYTALR